MTVFRAIRATRILSLLLAFVLVSTLLPASSSQGAVGLLYDAIPAVLPGAFTSVGYQATQTDEMGDHIRFAMSGKTVQTVVVNLTNWACGNDYKLVDGAWVKDRAAGVACASTAGSGFNHPLTLNIYTVDTASGHPEPGELILSKTISAFILFRPSADPVNCPGTDRWYSAAENRCYPGYAFNVEFDFSEDPIVLPDEIIYGLAFNTQTSGPAPLNAAGPFNSLNFSVAEVPPSAGTNIDPDDVFIDTSAGNGGDDTFRRQIEWAPYVPAVRFTTIVDAEAPVTSSVTVSPDPVPANVSWPVTISALVDDTAQGGSIITAAEARLEGSPTWRSLQAADGAFDEASEAVSGSFSPAELGLPRTGTVRLCVRGVDAEGNTGAETCATVSLRVLTFLPVIHRAK